MGSPRAKDARRPLLPRRNLAAGEESTGQTAGRLILTGPVRGVWRGIGFGEAS